MITVYKCDADKCPNAGVEFRVEDAPELVVCGGCSTPLKGNEAK